MKQLAYWMMIAMMILAGLAGCATHPAARVQPATREATPAPATPPAAEPTAGGAQHPRGIYSSTTN